MTWVRAAALAAVGVVLLATGYLAGLLLLFLAGVELVPREPQAVRPRAGFGKQLVGWARASLLVVWLVLGIGLVLAYVVGLGTFAGLVIGACAAVLAARALLRLDPAAGV